MTSNPCRTIRKENGSKGETWPVSPLTSATQPIGAWDRRAHFCLEYTHLFKCPAKKSHLQLREGSPHPSLQHMSPVLQDCDWERDITMYGWRVLRAVLRIRISEMQEGSEKWRGGSPQSLNMVVRCWVLFDWIWKIDHTFDLLSVRI